MKLDLFTLASRASAALAELGYMTEPYVGRFATTGEYCAKLHSSDGVDIPQEVTWKAWVVAGSPRTACLRHFLEERPFSSDRRVEVFYPERGLGTRDCGFDDQ